MPEKPSKKAEILEVASKLFFEQGYHATGIKQIIEAADIAKGTFYSHFKSKEELGLEWLKAGGDSWIACRDKFLAQVGPSPQAQLEALFDFLAQGVKSCNYRGCAQINTLAESPDLACPMRKQIQQYKREFLAFIRQHVDQCLPDASAEEQEHKAWVIFLLFEGATITAQGFCKSTPISIAKKQVALILA